MSNWNKGSREANAILIETRNRMQRIAEEALGKPVRKKAPPGFAGRGVEESLSLIIPR
jgi:hypothetical protein